MTNRMAVLLADISGSARLYEKLDDTEALHAVERCINRMERAVEQFSGRLIKAVGDELMAVFPTAEGACQAAIEMQHRVSDLPPVSGVKLAIRVGFHVGQLSEEGGEPAGETVDGAARITGLAKSGEILTSQEAAGELAGLLAESVRPLPQAGGQTGKMPLAQIIWQRDGDPSRSTTPAHDIPPKAVTAVPPRFTLRYRGRSFVMDDSQKMLALGRDPGCDVIVEDRKASRQHGRIERRGSQYFYLDRSSNGSYVTVAGNQEMLVRHTEIELLGAGSICFGTSSNHPAADCASFELK